MDVISIAILALALFAALTVVYYTIKNGIPPMPTTRYLCSQTSRVLAEHIQEQHVQVIEAGSGWGTLALYLGKRFPQLSLTGLENSLLPLWFAKWLTLFLRRKNCRFLRRDLYQFDYKDADVVVCYLFAGAMRKLDGIFAAQLPEHALVVSIFFALPGWEPIHIAQCNDLYRTKMYVYQVSRSAPNRR